ncbi:hypothetical protein FOXYSP1_14324 [Fusarium oxysporum f. sp. phaseoli]
MNLVNMSNGSLFLRFLKTVLIFIYPYLLIY